MNLENRESASQPECQEYNNLQEGLNALEDKLDQFEAEYPDLHSVVIISGPAGSGKTLFAEKLNKEQSTILDLDRYYLGAEFLRQRDGSVNFSNPTALDENRIRNDVTRILEANDGETIKVPVYDMERSTRTGEENLVVKKTIIITGVHALRQLEFVNTPFKIYIDVPEEILLNRGLIRDPRERGIPETAVRERFETNTRPALKNFVEPQKALAKIIIQNNFS